MPGCRDNSLEVRQIRLTFFNGRYSCLSGCENQMGVLPLLCLICHVDGGLELSCGGTPIRVFSLGSAMISNLYFPLTNENK